MDSSPARVPKGTLRTTIWLLVGMVAAVVMFSWPVSRNAVLLQTELGAVLLFLLHLGFAVTPAAFAWSHWGWLHRTELAKRLRALRPDALAWLLIVVVIGVETLVDPYITAALGWDFTSMMPAIEGRAVAEIQEAVRSRPLDILFTGIYAYGYLFLYGLLPGILLLRADPLARPMLRTILLAWAIGLPCYLFVPVDEPWALGYSTPVMHETIPPSAENDLVASAINNELPSLHSLLSVAMGATAWLEGRRRLALLLSPLAIGVPLATVYLGVHWVTDAVTGTILGVLCATASRSRGWLRFFSAPSGPRVYTTP